MKGSRIVILVLVIAVAGALVWRFAASGGSDTKKTETEKSAKDKQPVVAEQIEPAPEPNQLQSRRGRRGRMGDANEPYAADRGFSGMGGMDMMSMGMMGMGMMGQSAGSGDTSSSDQTESNQLEAINLQDVQMRSIIEKISQWTGKVVIPTNDSVMQQKVTIYSPSRIKRSEALALIFAALRAKGVAVEQAGNVIFLKPIPESKIGTVPAISPDVPLASLTDKNQIVQKTFVLKNYRAGKIYSLLSTTISAYGYIAADENTGNVTIIETVENLMRLEKMITRLDKPQPKGTEERIFQLTTGDATAIAQVVEKLMNTGTGQSVIAQDPNKPVILTSVTSVTMEDKNDQVILVPEVRNNWILVRAWPEDMEAIGLWIDKLDKEMQVAPEYDILQVRYVDVADLADKVGKTLQNMPGVTLKSSVLLQPLPKSRQIMLFGSADKREMVRRLVAEIDQPSSSLYEERTFLLRNADPDAIKKNIDDLYGGSATSTMTFPGGGGGGRFGGFGMSQSSATSTDTVKVISYPSLGQVTVIASPEQMAKIARQIEEWDVPVAVDKIKPRIVELVNSDPVKMSDLLSRLFSQEQAGSTTTGGNRNVFAAFLAASASTDKQGIIGPLFGQLSFEAVPDTKKIIVISKIPAAYDVVESLIRDLDRQEMGEVPTVITLKYADPEDLAQRLNAMFNQTGTSATIQLSSRGLSDYTVDTTTGEATTTSTTASSTSAYTPWWTRAQQSTSEAPISNIIGKVRFIPDTRSKSIMVLSPREYIDDIRTMIQKLDQPAKQVMVRAVILEVNQSDLATLGAEYSTDPTAFGAIGVNGATALTTLTSRSNPDLAGSATTRAGTFNTVTTANITVLLDLLVTKAKARILNQPTLWTRDNEEATFFRGRSVPFIVSTQTSSEGTATKDSVEYRGVGVTLRVRPNITPEKAVDMNVNLKVSQLDPQLVNGNIATSLLDTTTKTIVMDGQTIMMGGIIYQTDTETVNKVPLLGDIPLVGALFSHINSQKVNSELIVFITPYVIDTDIDAAGPAMQSQEMALKKMEETRAELRQALGLDPNDAPLTRP